ncbi:MAG: signal peptide peptidase SppA [Streptosporangiaceae bacterium]|nr:signal peptide peptidase SppA [Streptosporangiaceae bacterium]MBV9855556.1 signal peptide peptidase SppA [Streptosporangiaceae bacterium]
MADATLNGKPGSQLGSQLTAQVTRLRQRRTAPLILELDLTDGLAEGPPPDPVSALLTMRRMRLLDVLEGLRRAGRDDRVRALVVKVGGGRIGLAKSQELREAVAAFRETGKLTVAWAETFGDFVRGNLPYYLATAFDRIYLQPSGTLGLTGVAVEQVFVHDALAKIGVDFQSAKRHEYKTAADPLTERGFTGPAREAAQRLAESIAGQLTTAIAERRGKTEEQARELLDRGPFLAQQALDEGLVDALGYRDEVYDAVRKEAGADAVLQYVHRYQRAHTLAQRARHLPNPRERFVAMIYAQGPIRHGRSGRGPLSGGAMGSDTVAAALRAAGGDDRARAILLRVNSPGGSYTASDTIWREVVRVRATGKPVVVSMGDVAASGGYFISMAADVIVAQPGTLTGSIGVIMGKPVLRDMFGRAGVATDTVTEGAHATMFSASHPFTDEEWERINGWLDEIYADFTGKVAAGRRMPKERVHELARGRVWTGADAVANGLADETGGLHDAMAIARRRAGLPGDAPVRVFPRVTPLDQLRPAESSESRPAALAGRRLGGGLTGALPGDGADGSLARALLSEALFTDGWGPAWQLAARAGLPPYGPLMLPGIWRIS